MKVICKLRDKMALSNDYIEYSEPIYTKMDSIYGYLSVSMLKVNFFWYNPDSETVCCDDVSERFNVEYILS